jgi:competence protein ComEA
MSAPPSSPGLQRKQAILLVWPRSAQRALAILIGAATLLLAWYSCGSLRISSRPTELRRETGLYQVDLNHADRAELLQLPGVGESLAQRILDSRREHGEFRRIEDLRRVKGIGPATLEKLRPWVCITEEEFRAEEEADSVPKPVRTRASRESAAASASVRDRKLTAQEGRIDINRATAEELERLPGIGKKKARDIVAARQQRLFATVADLRRVKGIGPKTLEKLRPLVTVDPLTQLASSD